MSEEELICAHALRHLPDSIQQRLKLLDAIIRVCPDGSEVKSLAIESRLHLVNHERLQGRLPLFGS